MNFVTNALVKLGILMRSTG